MTYEILLAPILIIVAAVAMIAGRKRLHAGREKSKTERANVLVEYERDEGRRQRREANERAIRKKADRLDRKRAQIASQEEMAAIFQLIANATAIHKATLRAKYRQTVLTNEYGIQDRSRWEREIRYFFDNVVDPEVTHWALKKFDGSEYYYGFLGREIERLIEIGKADTDVEAAYAADMSGQDFERLVAARLTNAGADVRFTPTTGDNGADLVANYECRTIVIQCKRSGTPVGNKAVQEVYAGCAFHDGDEAWVVSDVPFTRQAQQLASTLSVRLIVFEDLEAAL